MEGVRYLIDDEGNKTHVVLDLSIWQTALQTLIGQAPKQPRKPGGLKGAFAEAGFTTETIGNALLEPMSEAELSEWYDRPLVPDEPSS